MTIAIIKYNAGNTRSVSFALERLGIVPLVTDNIEAIQNADKVIFPGVGEASSAMQYLRERKMDQLIVSLTQPLLGICLGQQLMCTHSEEGNTTCLGIFDAAVKKFPPIELVPHKGWNNSNEVKGRLVEGLNEADNVYYVHSYNAEESEDTTAICNYIVPFSAAIQKTSV